MKKTNYKILVLAEMNELASSTLKNGISLAKMVTADVHFFSVTKPTEIIEKESQLSAIRTINQKYNDTSKEIEKFIKPISDTYKITINSSHAFGNLKNEISNYISENKPDIIVLGKRKSKVLSILGDNVTDFILKTFDGILMIASNKNTVAISEQLSLGILNEPKTTKSKAFIENLISLSYSPPKVFKIYKDSNLNNKQNSEILKNRVEYVFEKGDNTLKNIANYLTKSNTNLVYLDRNENSENYTLKEIINNLNCALILTN